MMRWTLDRGRRIALRLGCAAAMALGGGAFAQSADAPSLWDPGHHVERPELTGLRALRFLTEDDYPPLNFQKPDGALAGFNVEIARAVCEELVIGCTIQARRFDTLVDSLLGGKGDAIVASLAPSAGLREKVDFSSPYYRTPARFAGRSAGVALDPSPGTLRGKKVAVVAGSAHESYLRLFFAEAQAAPFPDFASAVEALKSGAVDLAFADGLTLSIWLAGEDSAKCCVFRGGPYLESRFFGEGVGVAVRKEDVNLRVAIDWALVRLAQKGVYAELLRKYFPIEFQ
jgi:polar amino acid transport system substrate-binding protein